MITEAPIVLIHYGNSAYLQYTLACAQQYNPEKQVILLGDDHNKHYEKRGILHFAFADYMVSELTREFQQVFFILNHDKFRMAGKDDYYISGIPGHFWQRFNWLRYFILYEFMQQQRIPAVWTFDSDNMIVTPLGKLEPMLSSYDYGLLHGGRSMQGLIQNSNALGDCCRLMVSLFTDKTYLEESRGWLKDLSSISTFTEMSAIVEFNKRDTTYTRADMCFGGFIPVFDELITYPQGFETRDYDTATLKIIKRLFVKNGTFYFKKQGEEKYIPTVNLDCSWVPFYIFETILSHSRQHHGRSEYYEIIFRENFGQRVNRFIRFYSRRLANN
jgi:hypothetical protein